MSGVPEQAVLEAERSVLGAILAAASLDVAAGHRVLDRVVAIGLYPKHFYIASLGVLYAHLLSLHKRDVPLDPVSVAYELEQIGAEPSVVARLHQLAHEITAITPASRWAEIVIESARRRNVP